MIACPGGDFCALANARSIPMAAAITERFADLDELYDIGDIDLHISGCINSCGHHHSGHIGILGVDKDGTEWYQVTLGGSDGSTVSGALGAGQGDRPVVRRRRSARRGRGRDRHLPRASAPPANASSTPYAASASTPFKAAANAVRRSTAHAALMRMQTAQQTPMRFIDIHRDPGMPSAARTARPVSITPAPHLLLDAGAVARGARTLAGDDAGRACVLANDADVEDTRGRPAAARRWWCCSSRSGPTAAPTARPGCCARATASQGEVRAIGEVLVDMLPLLQRTGFDAVQLRPDQSIDAAERALGFFPGHYQGDVPQPRPLFARDLARRSAGRSRDGAELFAGQGHLMHERHRPVCPRHRGLRRARGPCRGGAAERPPPSMPAASCRPPAWAPKTWCVTDLIARHGLPIAGRARWTPASCTPRRWR